MWQVRYAMLDSAQACWSKAIIDEKLLRVVVMYHFHFKARALFEKAAADKEGFCFPSFVNV